MKSAKYFPALFFFVCWLYSVSSLSTLEKAVHLPLNSEGFITGMAKGMENPWTHTTALTFYFTKLERDGASRSLWVNSNHLAHAYWNTFQCKASLSALVLVNDAQDNTIEVNRLISKYPRFFEE